MINIAVLGYGVVGSGVVTLIDKNAKLFAAKAGEEVRVKYILDIRDFDNDPYRALLTKNFDDILNDPEVSVVAEVIGGVKVAYEFTKKCLAAGKSVVTSNKELVATYAPELMQLAYTNNARYLFEASVGGGIPILHPLRECTEANNVLQIKGILNGTTNYILTKMFSEGTSFDDALKDAQRLGYAEQNPSADVDGIDACRKIAILSSLAYGKHVDPNTIPTVGIRGVTSENVALAEKKGYRIKLIGYTRKNDDDTLTVFVRPCAVPATSVLANVVDVFNGIAVTGDAVGEVSFIGRGAGKMPTASAVCADILEIIRPAKRREDVIQWESDPAVVRPFDRNEWRFLGDTEIPVLD